MHLIISGKGKNQQGENGNCIAPPPSDPFDRAVVDPLHVSLFIYIHVSTYSVRERTERCYGRQQKALAVDKR